MLYQTKNPHGGDIYGDPIDLDYSANTNPFGTPPGVLAAIAEASRTLDRYPDPYCRRLVRAIADFEQVPEDRILCGSGAAELIDTYARVLRPRRAMELAPTFSEYSRSLEREGCQVSRYFLKPEHGFRPGPDLMDAIRENRPEVLFLCNPNNPTGLLLEEGTLEEILSLCRREGIRLFVDECFLDLTQQGRSLKSCLTENPNLFLLKAFTKSYGMAGVRLGYCLSADPELLREMSRAVQPWNISSLAQAAGTAALEEREFLRRTVQTLSLERQWLKDRLEELGFWVCPSRVNFLLFRGPEDLAVRLRRQRIAIRSCDNYPGLGPGWFRIAVRLRPENEMLIDAISHLMDGSL